MDGALVRTVVKYVMGRAGDWRGNKPANVLSKFCGCPVVLIA